MMAGMMTLILTGLLRGVRTQRSLVLENLALRHQPGWTDAISVVQPATVIRWQRTAFQLVWAWKSRRTGPRRGAERTHLRRLLRDYLLYYHRARTHLSLAKDAPEPRRVERLDEGEIVETPMVGGLHHRYSRLAA
jgi:hypothetical protein